MPKFVESLITGYGLNYLIEKKAKEEFYKQLNKDKDNRSPVQKAVDDYKRKNK